MMDRTSPPHDLDAERATIGSALMHRDAAPQVDHWLEPEHFYLPKHQIIWTAIRACLRSRPTIPPDIMTVGGKLLEAGQLERIGGYPALIEFLDVVPTSSHIEYYGRIVEKFASLRRLIAAGGKIAALGYDAERSLDDLITEATLTLQQAATRATDDGGEHIASIVDRIFEAWSSGEPAPGVSTGYTDLDDVLGGGLRAPDLIVCAARPSVGKTSLALCLARNVAKGGTGGGAMIFTQEMSREQIIERMAAVEAGIDAQKVRGRKFSQDELERGLRALSDLSGLPVWADDTPAHNVGAMQRKVARHQAQHGPLDLVIVDYLQLSTATTNKGANREQEVSAVSRGLKQLAMTCNVPVFALAQLSRAIEGRADHKPMLSDLRDSGAIEQDADIVAFIHREELYDPETDRRGIAEIIIAKQRSGPLGIVPLRFDATTTAFQNLQRYTGLEGY